MSAKCSCWNLCLLFVENQFRGVNKDEVAFLDQVANQTAKVEKQRNDEIRKELEDFRISFLLWTAVFGWFLT